MTRFRSTTSFGHADLEGVLEGVGIAVMTIDAQGILHEVNEASVVMFGYKREVMLGMNVSVLMPTDHARAHDSYLQHHIATGERRIIGRGRKVVGKRADDSEFPMHLAVGRFERDGEVFFSGVIHDLSDAERDHENATRLGYIVERSINEIFTFDVETLRFSIVNQSAIENLGYELDELHTMTPLDIKPLHDEESFAQLLAPLISGDTDLLRFQTMHERKDSTRYDVEVALHLSDAGGRHEYVAVVQDVTERNRLLATVQQGQKIDAIGQLTGGIAHDFNNLLTVISGNLELLDLQLEDRDARDLVGEAREAARMGAGLTNRLLSFAKKSSLAPESIDLNEHVIELAELWRRSLGESISLSLILAPKLWPVCIDVSLAESALMNLALNARDAMNGRGELCVETANRVLDESTASAVDLPAGDYVALSVTDDGQGVDCAAIGKLFDPFYTTRSRTGGHGLGLSMVYGFARQSGGHVMVESQLGQGACFTLLLPRGKSARQGQSRELPVVHVIPQRRRLILVVEDDDSVRRLTVRRLRRLGHDTLEATDGPEALQMFASHSDIDLLFTDMVMPNGLSGLEVARCLRKQDKNLPVVITSGYSDELLSTDVLMEEDITLLKKPYDNDSLSEALQALFPPS